MTELTTLDLFNLTASIFSVIMSILAIVLSLIFFFASKKAEKETAISINKIGEVTNTLNNLSMKMLNKMATALISPRSTDEKVSDILKAVGSNGGLLHPIEEEGSITKPILEQWRIDNLIAAFYYCAVSNMLAQNYLPPTIGGTEDDDGGASLVDQSKSDYDTLKNWILVAGDSEKKINESPVKHLFDVAISWSEDVKSTREYYATKEKEENPSI